MREGLYIVQSDRFNRHVARAAEKDLIKREDRIGQSVAVVIILLVFAFFVSHQTSDTGFFTDKFGTVEMVLFYSALLLGIAPAILKAVFGRKNMVRPIDAAGGVLSGVAALWLLLVFPFDFSHLADVLPSALQFVLSWITDGLAMIVFALAFIASVASAAYNAMLFALVRKIRLSPAASPEQDDGEV